MKNEKLGESLRDHRQAKGLTIVKLEALTGVDVTYLGRIERGERYPSAKILQKLAGPLGYDEAELLKLAGYLSYDRTDDRIAKFKESMEGEIKVAMANLMAKVNTL